MLARAARLAGFAGMLMLATGCYTYVPAITAPVPGTEVAVVLTDRGRIALNDRVGPAIDELRGVLTSSTDSAVGLSMRESISLRGESAKWTDEPIVLSRDHFGSIRIRQLSRGRTGAMAGAFGGAVAFFVITGGFGDDGRKIGSDPTTPPSGPGNSSRVLPLPFPFRSDF